MNPISLTEWSLKAPHFKTLLEWRNNPQTRSFSFSKTPYSEDRFIAEFHSKFFSLKELPPLWIEYKRQKVGFISFKKWFRPSSVELSIFLDPKFQAKEIGPKAIELACTSLKEKKIEEAIAWVLPKNKAARQAFEKAGFEEVGLFKYEQTHENALKFIQRLQKPSSLFIIAEAGSNFKGSHPKDSFQRAKRLIEIAYQAKAHAVKFQLYDDSCVYAKGAGSPGYLKEDINAIFKAYALDPSWIQKLYDYSCYVGIEWMCSTFSESFFDLVDPFVQRHKIASYEINHLRLLEKAALSKKPLILSTGACQIRDIKWALETFKKRGGKEIVLMHCNAQYPAEIEGLNLNCIKMLKEHFQVQVGFSDHSLHPTLAPTLAVALGASVIEKHFTLSKKDPGPDHFFALEPKELEAMTQALFQSEKMLGLAKKTIFPQEEDLSQFTKRGLHALKTILKGEPFIEGENIGILRPGQQKIGLHPRYIAKIEHKRATRALLAGEGLQKEDIEWT